MSGDTAAYVVQHRARASLLCGFFFSGLFLATFSWLCFSAFSWLFLATICGLFLTTFCGLFLTAFSGFFLATFCFVGTARRHRFVIGICCRSVIRSVICSATAADYCKSHQHGTQHRQESLHSKNLNPIIVKL